jgi:hypothetical protein
MTLGIEPQFPAISARRLPIDVERGHGRVLERWQRWDEARAVRSYMSESGRGSSQGTIARPGALSSRNSGVDAATAPWNIYPHSLQEYLRCYAVAYSLRLPS